MYTILKNSKKKIVNSFQWYDQNIDQLNQCVESGDYERASEMVNEYHGDSELLQSWDHYHIVIIYRNTYRYFDDFMAQIDEKKSIDQYTFTKGFDYAMDYLNMMTNKKNHSYTRYINAPEKDKKIMDAWLERVKQFFTETVGVSEEQYMADLESVNDLEWFHQVEENYYEKFIENYQTK